MTAIDHFSTRIQPVVTVCSFMLKKTKNGCYGRIRFILAGFIASIMFVPACQHLQTNQYAERGPYHISYNRAFSSLKDAVSNRFSIKKINKEKGTIMTDWQYTEGYFDVLRTRIRAKVEPQADKAQNKPGQYYIKLRMEREEAVDFDRQVFSKKEELTFRAKDRLRDREKDLLYLIHFDLKKDRLDEQIRKKMRSKQEQKQKFDQYDRYRSNDNRSSIQK